jgi:hypothetical protein
MLMISTAPSMSTLAKLLPSLRSLDIRFPMTDIDDREFSSVLSAIATLSSLRKLHVQIKESWVAVADLGALRSLSQLQELCLDFKQSPDAGDADIAALLCALGGLRNLALGGGMQQLTPTALRIVGEALPRLRYLELVGNWSLLPALEAARNMPLFPSLRYFNLFTFEDETAFPYGR